MGSMRNAREGETGKCPWCGTRFEQRGRLRIYCSEKCYNDFWVATRRVSLKGLSATEVQAVHDFVAGLREAAETRNAITA